MLFHDLTGMFHKLHACFDPAHNVGAKGGHAKHSTTPNKSPRSKTIYWLGSTPKNMGVQVWKVLVQGNIGGTHAGANPCALETMHKGDI
jgi:hypothetical protein